MISRYVRKSLLFGCYSQTHSILSRQERHNTDDCEQGRRGGEIESLKMLFLVFH